MPTIPIQRARRIALAAQGFADRRPTGNVNARHFRRVLDRVSVVQLDSVNVVARAHYLPFFARLGPYDPAVLDRWIWRSGELFEYWAHEASVTAITRRPLLAHRMDRGHPWWKIEEVTRDHPGYVEAVLAEVADRGPLAVGKLTDPGERTGPWWGYGKGKIALEWLFASGQVTVADRPNFTRMYDIPERVHPREVLEWEAMEKSEAVRELLALGARAHGIGTLADFADYYRLAIADARQALPDLVARGEIAEVKVEGWKAAAYLHSEAKSPRRIEGTALLAPFDPLIWFRDRTERLFGFHYRVELYTPKPRRIFGYYVMPALVDGELVARIDLKADRQGRTLQVRGAFAESGADVARVAAPIAEELRQMAGWLGLDGVEIHPNGDLSAELRRAV